MEDERIRNQEENLTSLVRSNLCRGRGTNNVNILLLYYFKYLNQDACNHLQFKFKISRE